MPSEESSARHRRAAAGSRQKWGLWSEGLLELRNGWCQWQRGVASQQHVQVRHLSGERVSGMASGGLEGGGCWCDLEEALLLGWRRCENGFRRGCLGQYLSEIVSGVVD